MAELVVVTPSRGRPAGLREMVEAVHSTAEGAVAVMVGLDLDDPADYAETMLGYDGGDCVMYMLERKSLCGWTNHLAKLALDGANPPRFLASLGDDHRPRTKGWDRRLIEAIEQLGGPGFSYGNDLLQGRKMPTAWVASAEVVRALQWMMLPGAEHMYVDAAILALGEKAGRIVYRPDVVIEHLHPLAGKANWDESYRESNTDERYAADRAAFEAWRVEQLHGDAALLAAMVYEGRVT